MANRIPNPVKRLSLADPEIAQTLADAWQRRNEPLSTRAVAELADQVIWGLSQSERFGRAIATGYHVLLGCADSEALQLYREQVRSAGAKGATLGVLIAKHLAEILQAGDARLVQQG